MHHATLDRAGAHDGHFHHQVVVLLRLQPRQHAHLRARFDLEHADGVGGLDHLEGRLVIVRQARKIQTESPVLVYQVYRLPDAGQHAQRQAVDLEQPHRLQIVLVPLDDGALVHRRVLDRHYRRQRRIADHEATHVLRKMPRVVAQLVGHRQHAPDQRIFRVETRLAQALLHRCLAVAPAIAVGQQCDLVRRQAERLGHVAHRALAAITDHRGGQRGTAATVLGIDVLQHFLAAFMLEVDVDIGWLVALFGQEARHQQAALGRIHHSDAQREAHGRIRRRAAALAEDVACLGETDDVFHGQEERFVLQLLDQRELTVDLRGHGGGHALRPALAHAAFREFAQPRGGRVARRHQLGRIAVVDVALEVEPATPRQRHRGVDQGARIDVAQRPSRAQVAFAVAEEVLAAFGQRCDMADRRHRVLQRATAAHVHVHVAGRHRHHGEACGGLEQARESGGIVLLTVQFDRHVRAIAEHRLQPSPLRFVDLACRQPEREQAADGRIDVGQEALHVLPREPVALLVDGAPGGGDQFAQPRVAGRGFHQQHALQSTRQGELAADDEGHLRRARRLPTAHDAGQRAFVGDRERFITEIACALEQFLRTGRAAQEREVRQAMQFRIGRPGIFLWAVVVGRGMPAQPLRHLPSAGRATAGRVAVDAVHRIVPAHANHPCSIQPPCSPGGAKAQARWPCEVSST